MKNAYIALWTEEAVRNVEIFNGTDLNDPDAIYDDTMWDLVEDAEVFIGIFEGEDEEEVLNRVVSEKNTSEDCIRLISLNTYIDDKLKENRKNV